MGKGDWTRARILDEALRLASRDGLEGLSIGTLATAAGLSKSGLFAHFGSKENLQVAVLMHAAERFQEGALPVEDLPPGPQRLERFLEALMDWIDDPARPGGCPILAASFELDDREGPVRDALVARYRGKETLLARYFRDFLPEEAIPQACFEFQAIGMGYHHASRVMRDPQARDRARKALAHLLSRQP